MYRKRILLTGIALILLVGLGILLFKSPSKLSTTKLTLHRLPVSPEISSVSYNKQSNNLVFSNGRFLVSYNLTSKATTQLTNTTSLPQIIDIQTSPDKQYIAFQTAEQADNETLKQILGSEGLVDASTWWVVGVQSQTISVVGQDISNVTWDSSSRLMYLFDQSVTAFNPSTNEREVIYSNDLLSDFRVYQNNLTVLTSEGKVISYSIASGEENVIATESGFILFDKNSECYLSSRIQENSDHSDLFLNMCGSYDEAKLGEIHEGFFGFSENSGALVYENENGIVELDPSNKKEVVILLNTLQSSRIQKIFDTNMFLLKNDENYEIASNKDISIEIIEDDASFTQNGITFELSSEDQFITLSKATSFTTDDLLVAEAILRNQGYDPNLYRMFSFSY